MTDQPERLPAGLRQALSRALCHQHPSGAWIHRTPHTCPQQVRSQMPPRKRRKR